MKKFSIRDLLLVTAIVAILCGWWLEHRDSVRLRKELADELNKRDAVSRFLIQAIAKQAPPTTISNDSEGE